MAPIDKAGQFVWGAGFVFAARYFRRLDRTAWFVASKKTNLHRIAGALVSWPIMILAPRHFVRFLDGRAGDVATIAFLPLDLGAHMPTQASDVKIRRDYALKLMRRHRMTYEKFQLIQQAIDNGWCFKAKANHLEFVYIHDGGDGRSRQYTLVLKSARWGQETWLVTFFRSQPQQLRTKQRRGMLIRSHTWTIPS